MIASIELQVISKILTTEDADDLNTLCSFDTSYYAVFKQHIQFILDHYHKYDTHPDVFTFQAEFPDVTLVHVAEPITYLVEGLKKNKQHIILLDMFNKVKDLGSGDVSDAWAYITNQCELANNLSSLKPVDIVKDAEERSDKIIEFNKQARIPTGFAEIDKLMYGGLSTVEELLLIVARTNTGKAQPLWSKVLTPSGWKTMGEIEVGDVVVGRDNDNGRVVQIFPQGLKDYYRITFDDNTTAECCDDHLWEVLDSDRRKRQNEQCGEHIVLTTKQIRDSLHRKYSVDISEAIEFDVPFDENNELDGYLLGVILGDGGLRDNRVTISNESEELWSRIEKIIAKYNCRRSGKLKNAIRGAEYGNNFVRAKIIEYGLMGKKSIDKFIPKQYLTAPVHVRKALLAGLVDTDGYALLNRPVWEFDTASEQLAKDFAELARSLGVLVKMHERVPSQYKVGDTYVPANGSRHLVCRSTFNPFWLSCKANKYCYRDYPIKRSMLKRHCKMIRSIEYVGKTECQCILLDNNTHTYITDSYTVTHNSWVCIKMMESAQKHGFPVLYYSPEMQSSFIGARFDTWRGHFQNNLLYQGKYSEEYQTYIKKLSEEPTSAYVLEDKDVPSGAVTPNVLRTMVQQHKIKLLIIDGLSYMQDDKKSEAEYLKYKNLCLELFKISKQYGCAVVIALQANRDTKDTKDEKGEPFPSLYNVEASDHPARICTQAFALRQIFDKHVLDIRLEKSRIANNQKPVLSYAWDPNTGTMEYMPEEETDTAIAQAIKPATNIPGIPSHVESDDDILDDDDDFDDVEF